MEIAAPGAAPVVTLLFLGNLCAGFSGLTQRNRYGLLAALYFLPAAGFEFALLVFFHHLVDFGLSFSAS